MKTLNIHETKTHLSKLLEEVQSGEDIIIAKAGKPIAKLVSYTSSLLKRQSGTMKNQIIEADDAWTTELDSEIARDLEKSPFLTETPISYVADSEAEYNTKKNK